MTDPTQPPLPQDSPDTTLLLTFLSTHDCPCPLCGYNLKSLTRPQCPECGQPLSLSVSAPNLRLAYLLASLAPGFFSGIAALFLLIPIFARLFVGDGQTSPLLNSLDLFGLTSGLFAIALATRRHRFLTQPLPRQRYITLAIWLTHVAALALFLLAGFGYLS